MGKKVRTLNAVKERQKEKQKNFCLLQLNNFLLRIFCLCSARIVRGKEINEGGCEIISLKALFPLQYTFIQSHVAFNQFKIITHKLASEEM